MKLTPEMLRAYETIRHGIEFLEEWPETYEATLQALDALVAEVEQLRERCAQSEHFKYAQATLNVVADSDAVLP